MMTTGQKQLRPCPTGERTAIVEKMVLTRSSGKRRQSLQNSFWRKLLFIFLRDDNRQEMFRLIGYKTRMIWEHVNFPFFNDWQITTPLHLLEQTIHKSESSPNARYPFLAHPECSSIKLCATETTQAKIRLKKPGHSHLSPGWTTQ